MFNSFQPQLVVELLWRATWQSAALAAVVGVLMLVARKQIAPRWRVILWSLPLVRLALLVIPGSSLSLFNMFESTHAIGASSLVGSMIATPDSNIAFSGTLIATDPVDLPVIADSNRSALASSGVIPRMVGEEVESADQPGNFASLFWAWLIGCAVSGLLFILGKAQLARVIARAMPLERSALAERLTSRCRALGFWRRVTCLIVDAEVGPASTGLIRPKILLPQALLRELNDDQLMTIIEHELQHIHRFDALYLLLGRLVCCFHWFNPLAYWLSARIRAEIELAVDAATVEHIDDQSRIAYGNLLIRLATRRARSLGLASMVDRRSNLQQRIAELASPIKNTTLRSACCLGAILLLIVTCLSDIARTQEKSSASPPAKKASRETIPAEPQTAIAGDGKYFIEGRITDEVSGDGVPDAEVQILVPSEENIDKRILKTRSDLNGHYRVAVPLGGVRLWFPSLKPGYWIKSPTDNMTQLSTSTSTPIAVHNITATPASAWKVSFSGELPEDEMGRIVAVMEVPDDVLRRKIINQEQWSSQEPINQWNSVLSSNQTGAFTQIGESGKLIIGVGTASAELLIESGFNNSSVASVKQVDGSDATEMRDANGLKATVNGAKVTLENGVATLHFSSKISDRSQVKLSGEVVDSSGKPVVGAEVRMAMRQQSGGGIWPASSTKTDERGLFYLDVMIAQDWAMLTIIIIIMCSLSNFNSFSFLYLKISFCFLANN